MRREQTRALGKRDVTLANVDDSRAMVSGVDQTTSGRAEKEWIRWHAWLIGSKREAEIDKNQCKCSERERERAEGEKRVRAGAIPLAGNVQIDEFALGVVHTDYRSGHLWQISG